MLGVPSMERARHILAHTSGSGFYSHELHATGRTALDGHCGLATAEVLGHQCNEFFICLSLHGWRLELSGPQPGTFFHEDARACTRFDLDLNDLHCAQGALRKPIVALVCYDSQILDDERKQMLLVWCGGSADSGELSSRELDVGVDSAGIFMEVQITLGLPIERPWCSLNQRGVLSYFEQQRLERCKCVGADVFHVPRRLT